MYACASCKSLGKTRVVTVENCRIFSRKHLEVDHDTDCSPVSVESVDVLEIDQRITFKI